MVLAGTWPKTELTVRNRLIYECYQASPELTYADISKFLGRSRQRVHYLIKRQMRIEPIKRKSVLMQEGNKAKKEVAYGNLALGKDRE